MFDPDRKDIDHTMGQFLKSAIIDISDIFFGSRSTFKIIPYLLQHLQSVMHECNEIISKYNLRAHFDLSRLSHIHFNVQ